VEGNFVWIVFGSDGFSAASHRKGSLISENFHTHARMLMPEMLEEWF
jgi:hypothetical protein